MQTAAIENNRATLLAGGFVAFNGRAPNPEEAMALVVEHALIIEHQALNQERDDAGEVLSQLPLHLEWTNQTERTLGDLMVDAFGGQQSGMRRNTMVCAEQILGRYHVRVIAKGKNAGVFLRNNSSALNRVLRKHAGPTAPGAGRCFKCLTPSHRRTRSSSRPSAKRIAA